MYMYINSINNCTAGVFNSKLCLLNTQEIPLISLTTKLSTAVKCLLPQCILYCETAWTLKNTTHQSLPGCQQ